MQLAEPHRAARFRLIVGYPHQAQEQPPRHLLPGRVERAVDLVGGVRDRVLDTPAGLVVGHGQLAALAAGPGGEQCMGQQRQRARLVRRGGRGPAGGVWRQIAEQQLDQAIGHAEPGQPGRLHDGRSDLGPGHRADHDLAFLQCPGQPGMTQRPVVEVGAQRDSDHRGAGQRAHRGDETALLGLVRARGEDLFQLVQHDDRAGAGWPGRAEELGRGRRVGAQRGFDRGAAGRLAGRCRALISWRRGALAGQGRELAGQRGQRGRARREQG